MSNTLKTVCFAALFAIAGTASAQAVDYSNAATYNTAYGMSAGQENSTVNPSLRDGNGNLTVVTGQFTSSSMSQQSGAQTMGPFSNGSTSSGVGFGSATGTASAIGNSLNVVTNGNNNTVIVNSTQTNNGNQTATVAINGH
jgi:holdfast attachment protein HfaA